MADEFDIKWIKHMSNLKKLMLPMACKIQNTNLIARFKNLEELYAGSGEISDISFVHNLHLLIVADFGLNFGLNDIRPLIGLNHLEQLDISMTAVTDFKPLYGLQNLKHLTIGNLTSDINNSDIAKLRASLPKCEIEVSE